jgi:diguanylate cyclase (GGDEF)-like protein
LDSIVQIQHASPDTPVIAFSDLDDDALAIQAMHAGAQDFVVKHGSNARMFHRTIRYAMERHKAQRQLNYLASHDPLTTLANRALFEERLNLTLARASRKQTQFAILYVDLDRFKGINDTLGHEVGDTVLAVTSSRLEDEVREYDTVARLGGDEFAILIDTINGPAEAQAVAERILRTMQVPFRVAGHTLEITGSIGISVYPLHGENTGLLLRAADSAMYRAKRAGGSGYRFYSARASNPAGPRTEYTALPRRAHN